MITSENTNIQYLLSRHLLKQLLEKGLINQQEFEAIDRENQKTFK